MITIDDTKQLKHGDILYHVQHQNRDGTPARWKVNGKVKFWKTRPNDFRIPVKRGLYQFDYVTHKEAELVCLDEKEAMEE